MLDWGSLDQLALALAGAVYIWNPSNGETCHLMQLEGEDYVSSVRWIGQGSILAVGNSNCQVQVYNKRTYLLIAEFSVRTVNWGPSFIPSIYGPSMKCMGHKSMEKNEDP